MGLFNYQAKREEYTNEIIRNHQAMQAQANSAITAQTFTFKTSYDSKDAENTAIIVTKLAKSCGVYAEDPIMTKKNYISGHWSMWDIVITGTLDNINRFLKVAEKFKP